jgi:site-specific DNA-methyltransferase (adenine-specific)
MALEDAGWEVRDSIHHVFGSGFPKSRNVARDLDKLAGEKRAVVGTQQAPGMARANVEQGAQTRTHTEFAKYDDAPVSDLAKQFEGWGTALKPAHEVWFLCRKPLDGTVGATVAKWGTGGLNIDGCRVAAPGEKVETHSRSEEASEGRPVYGKLDAMDTHQTAGQTLGRFPPNFLLSHHSCCERVGVRKVRSAPAGQGPAPTGTRRGDTMGAMSGDAARFDYLAADGTETIDAWACAPGCPVAGMDGQSGEGVSRKGQPRGAGSGEGWGMTATGAEYDDRGGASRFVPNFAYETADFLPFLYEAKPATSEKERGLAPGAGRLDPSRDPDAPGANNPRNRGGKQRGNTHPTVKSIALMSWLCRLVTPPKGVVLDPFMGSGTTGVAALREGFRFVGCEREAEYVAIARRRIEEDRPLFNRPAPVAKPEPAPVLSHLTLFKVGAP